MGNLAYGFSLNHEGARVGTIYYSKCTKNLYPMLKYLDELKEKYDMFWFVTITPYGKDLEPNVLPFEKVLEDFKVLSSKIGKNAVATRYDPILINEEYSVEKHIEMFDLFAKSLKSYM